MATATATETLGIDAYMDTGEVAKELGVTRRQVRQFISTEQMSALRVGSSWAIRRPVVRAFATSRRTGETQLLSLTAA